jgi:hypothetical protein
VKTISKNIQQKKEGKTKGFIRAVWGYRQPILRSKNNPYSGPYTTATVKLISENIQLKKEDRTRGFIETAWGCTQQPGTTIRRGHNKPYKTTRWRP